MFELFPLVLVDLLIDSFRPILMSEAAAVVVGGEKGTLTRKKREKGCGFVSGPLFDLVPSRGALRR